jgi:hypothetical protein
MYGMLGVEWLAVKIIGGKIGSTEEGAAPSWKVQHLL